MRRLRIRFMLLLAAAPAVAQTVPPAVIEMDFENVRFYHQDSVDFARWATDAGRTDSPLYRNFSYMEAIGDVSAVNGQRVRGTITIQVTGIRSVHPDQPRAGQSPADISGGGRLVYEIDIHSLDGSPIGSLFATGRNATLPGPAGSPIENTGNMVIVGGTGAWFGARGQMLFGPVLPGSAPQARASVTEDPANRRLHGGLAFRRIAWLILDQRPQIVSVLHADMSPVTESRPARPGEVLIAVATGLGPTRPGIMPGQSFPPDTFAEVTSPVRVLANGQAAEVINKIGWPGRANTYRVDFRLTGEIQGSTAALQLESAWVPGPEFRIPAR